jgi:hypothetical protein
MNYKTAYWDDVSQSQKERDCTPEEVAEIEVRKTAPVPILAQILAIEATVTQRRLREAVTTVEGKAWLADVDSQIAALRAQLT